MFGHVFDVTWVAFDLLFKRKGDFLAVNRKHCYSPLQQPIIEFIVLHQLEFDEHFYLLLEHFQRKYLIILNLFGKLRMTPNLQVHLLNLLKSILPLILLFD